MVVVSSRRLFVEVNNHTHSHTHHWHESEWELFFKKGPLLRKTSNFSEFLAEFEINVSWCIHVAESKSLRMYCVVARDVY